MPELTHNARDGLKARDIRSTTTFQRVEDHYRRSIDPGIGKISAATELVLSPDGDTVFFTARIWKSMETGRVTRVASVDLATGTPYIHSSGPGNAQKPRVSPDGRQLSFTSTDPETGLSQLCILGLKEPRELRSPKLPSRCSVEYALWSADSRGLLCGIAPAGADTSDLHGALKLGDAHENGPAWLPHVEASDVEHPPRTLLIYDLVTGEFRPASPAGLNVWEANWCGPGSVAAVVSDKGDESSWYTSRIAVIDLETLQAKDIYQPPDLWQPALPVGSRSGSQVAWIQAHCSDRCVVAGQVWTMDVETQQATRHDTGAVDVTSIDWLDDDSLFVFGVRGVQVAAGKIRVTEKTYEEVWAAADGVTVSGLHPDSVVPSSDGSAFPIALEGWSKIAEITVVREGKETPALSLKHDGNLHLQSVLGESKLLRWVSSDGLEIEGFLRLPKTGNAPYPLILHIHGGPIAAWRDTWPSDSIDALLTLNGFAVLCPNTRGSSGRGPEFARHIIGDMGGKDVDDYLSGIDHVVALGLADPNRLGVTGGSYGGFMSSWLISRTDRFAASVVVVPVVDWFSQHTLSNIQAFDRAFMQGDPYDEQGGQYRTRSPILYAGRYKTPVLLVAGELDPATPPTQAKQYHNALVEKGVTSQCVIYPGEGHRVRKYPAYVDYCSRLVGWFQAYIPSKKV